LTSEVQTLQQQSNQVDQDLMELHEIVREVTQFLTDNKKLTESLESNVQELNHSTQPVIDSLFNRIRESNEKMKRIDEQLQAHHREIRALQDDQHWQATPALSPSESSPGSGGGGGGYRQSNDNRRPRQRSFPSQHGEDEEVMSEEETTLATEELLMRHEEKIQQITSILNEQHTDYQESISKLSASNRKLKMKVKELYERMGPLGDIKGSIDHLLTDLITGTSEDRHVIQTLKEENSELVTEVLSMKILCESMQEKYEEIVREMRKRGGQHHDTAPQSQQRCQSQSQDRPSSAMSENLTHPHMWPTTTPTVTTTTSPTGRGQEEERSWKEDFLKLEEKIQTMNQTIQHISTHQEREKKLFADSKDRPMGMSEMRLSSNEGRDQGLQSNGVEPSSRRVNAPVVIDDDALSLISETWHGTLATHDSRPHFNPLAQHVLSNIATTTSMMSMSMTHR
jgi:hypothetical protein